MKNTFENQANNITLEESAEWKKTKVDRMNKYQIIRNNFITLLIFNFIDLSGFSFACLFYQWFKIGYFNEHMWVNFLYIKYKEEIIFIHSNYDQVYQNFCKQFDQKDYNDCISSFELIKNIGIAAFSFIVVGLILHILEIIRLIYILRGQRNKMCLKAFFLHPLILISLSLPILLYVFMIIYLVTVQENGKFSFGASFYVAGAFFVFYFIVLIYYKQQKKRLEVHETMDKLLIELNRNLDKTQNSNVISSSDIQQMDKNKLDTSQGENNFKQGVELERKSTFVL